jgi:hypothetical protein
MPRLEQLWHGTRAELNCMTERTWDRPDPSQHMNLRVVFEWYMTFARISSYDLSGMLSSMHYFPQMLVQIVFDPPPTNLVSRSASHRVVLRSLTFRRLITQKRSVHAFTPLLKRLTSVSCAVPPSRILITHSSSLWVPNSFSSVALLAASEIPCAPCLHNNKIVSIRTSTSKW